MNIPSSQNTENLSQEKDLGFSVLISVYSKERPKYFNESLASIFDQTLPPSEVVIVCDGPLTEALEAILEKYLHAYPQVLKIVRIEKNEGLGNALNLGMKHCSNDLIVRMDSDDYSLPTRFEKQIGFMREHPDIDVLSCTISEFNTDLNDIVYERVLPEEHEKLSRFARLRNPINHPGVVFRRKAVLEAGGYLHFYLFEDYYLWARMLMNGAKFHALRESLLCFRMNRATFSRRRGKAYIESEFQLQKRFLKMGFTNRFQYLRNIVVRIVPRLLPQGGLKAFYGHFLRSRRKK